MKKIQVHFPKPQLQRLKRLAKIENRTNVLYYATNTACPEQPVTLRGNGVDTFYIRNVPDFESFGWFQVMDPLG